MGNLIVQNLKNGLTLPPLEPLGLLETLLHQGPLSRHHNFTDTVMLQMVFVIALISILIIVIASFSALIVEEFEFFPPPSKDSWQYRTFWLLFRVMFIGLLFLSIGEFSPQPVFNPWIRYMVWLPLLIVGFGGATYLSAKLGWENAHGEKSGLVVSGPYRWSRNPIYVASLIGMIGWGFFVNSYFVSVLLSLWGLLYISAPFIEEQWLERTYGDTFLAYKSQSSRFIGFPKQEK